MLEETAMMGAEGAIDTVAHEVAETEDAVTIPSRRAEVTVTGGGGG